MVGSSFDLDIHFYFLLLVVAAGTLVVVDILVQDVIPALGCVMPLHYMRNSHGSSVLDYSVWAG